MAPHEGERVAGRYLLEARVGRGGMGEVWRARDTVLERVVAVKRVRLDDLDEGHALGTRQRVMREARIAARLHHPAAVTIFDVVEHGGEPWLVLEYLPSRSLAEVVDADGPLEPVEAARIGFELADALDAAHDAGIVHRDIKPANVLVGDRGPVKLTDFGISRLAGDVTLTGAGLLVGTPAYLAPEVAAGGEATAASDVFCLGATLYAAVEGAPPFGSGADTNLLLLLRTASEGRITPPRRAGPLTGALLAMLQTDPARRPDASGARDMLAAVAAGRVAASAPPRPAARPRTREPDDAPDPRGAVSRAVPPDAHEPATAVTARPRRRRPLVVAGAAAALAVALVVVLTVVLRGDGSPVAPGPATCDTSRGTLVVGVVVPLTGDLAPLGEGVRNSVELAVAQADMRCAVRGYRLAVEAVDDRNDPAAAAEVAGRLAASANLIGIVGGLSSSTSAAVQPVLAASGVVQIAPTSTDPRLTLGPDAAAPRRPYSMFFRMSANDRVIGPAAVEYLAPLAKRRVVVIDDGSRSGTELAGGFLQRAQQRGFTVLAQERLAPGSDPADVVGRVRGLDPQAVFYAGAAAPGGRLSAAMGATGLDVPLVGGSGLADAEFVRSGGRQGDLAVVSGAPGELLGQSVVPFEDAYAAGGFTASASDFGPFAYDAATALVEATATSVRAYDWSPDRRTGLIGDVQRTELEGATGPISFDPYGDPTNRLVTIQEVRDGELVPARTLRYEP
jgi:ABC-type branched-subunit amino acid transport system substrate-binding protein/tRNA A-37 threonylcarbamoyl transferase component Bud32